MKDKEPRLKLPITVEAKEVAKILEHTNQMHHKVAFILAFGSGLRISEVLKLTIDKFNFERNRIFVEQGKGGKDRFVNIPVYWHEELNKYIPIGISKRALQNAFDSAAIRAGIRTKERPVHFHSLRHGFATHLHEQGTNIYDIQMLLGHSNVGTTSIYVNVNPYKSIKNATEAWER